MRTHVPSNVSAEWSSQNATDDQRDDVLDMSPPKLDEKGRCHGDGDKEFGRVDRTDYFTWGVT
jgi:hypothetical protein